jgi:hypothetical protein
MLLRMNWHRTAGIQPTKDMSLNSIFLMASQMNGIYMITQQTSMYMREYMR